MLSLISINENADNAIRKGVTILRTKEYLEIRIKLRRYVKFLMPRSH